MSHVPELRVTARNDAPVRPHGEYVLYWMISSRRVRWNFALDRALEHARRLGRPVLIFEPLRAGYAHASDRLHAFAIEGMRDNRARCSAAGVTYYPYVEPTPGAGRGLLAALAARACVVVTDDFPTFFLPRMVQAAADALPVRVEAVDSNGLLPMRAGDREFTTAFSFRAFLQKKLPEHLADRPVAEPLKKHGLANRAALPEGVEARWPPASENLLALKAGELARLPIDHRVAPSPVLRGGSVEGEAVLRRFVADRLARYADRNEPDADVASGLSPFLHWGHVSSHEIFDAVVRTENWDLELVGTKGTGGKREGWWGLSAPVEGFLDQLVTWREIGFNLASRRPDHASWESLPEWARATLGKHASDPRKHLYSLPDLDTAQTADPIWNAAQVQLVREGRMHNYLRMLWGKKVLEWSASPQEALATLVHLNDRYALDGRDPNSYSGICWTFGRYDRPWGPERPIFGTIRYMSSDNTARKIALKQYLATYGRRTGDLFG